jgi:hypothetical protein
MALPQIDTLWMETLGDPSICIAILDDSCDLSHLCFDGARLPHLETHLPGVDDQ